MRVKLFFILFFVVHFFYSQVDRFSVMGLPNVTDAEMNGIITPFEGSVVYNTTDKKHIIGMELDGLLLIRLYLMEI